MDIMTLLMNYEIGVYIWYFFSNIKPPGQNLQESVVSKFYGKGAPRCSSPAQSRWSMNPS